MKDCDHKVGRIGDKIYSSSGYVIEFEKMRKRIEEWSKTNGATPFPGFHDRFNFCPDCGEQLKE